MKIRMKPGHILSSLYRRFPAPALLCLLLTVSGIASTLVHALTDAGTHTELRELVSVTLPAIFATGLCLSTGAACLCLRLKWPRFLQWIAGAAGCFLGWLIKDHGLAEAGVLIASIAAAFHGISTREQPAKRLGQAAGWFFTSAGLSLVMFMALMLCSSAVFELILPDSGYTSYSTAQEIIAGVCFMLFAPWMFLGGLPDVETDADKRGGFRKFAATVLLPLYLLLIAVLLLYVAKTFVMMTMPVGTMNGYAITALSLFVCFHLVLTGEENKLAKLFCDLGGWLLIPIIIAQGIGVWIRVEAYGFTTARILGIIWTALCIAVLICSLFRKRADWFFAAAAVIALVFCCTPLNAGNLARMDQEQRLEAALIRNGMLHEDGTISANPEASAQDQEIIWSAVDYLSRLGDEAPEESMTALLSKQIDEIKGASDTWTADITAKQQLLGFGNPDSGSSYYDVFFTFDGSASQKEVNVKGYDHIRWISIYHNGSPDILDGKATPPTSYGSFDEAALIQSIKSALETGEPIKLTAPITVVLDGEECDLSPLIEGLVITGEEAALPADTFTLPSGKVLHLETLNVVSYTNLSLNEYITLRGWLMTPEAE